MARREAPKYLTEEEIERLFRVITNVRDRAIFRLCYHRGLRASEPAKLMYADWRRDAGRLFVRRLKGSNSGEYLLTHAEQSSLRAWERVRGTQPGPLFCSRVGRPISRWRLDELMKKYCALAGIEAAKAHMHVLKHSCGTHLQDLERDITVVQDHLGHRNIQNTMIYVTVRNKRRDESGERLRDWGRKR